METKLTKKIKHELLKQRPMRGYYAAPEVTIKSNYLRIDHPNNIYDRADVVEWDDNEHFTCYEINVSKEDAKSDNIISMFGYRNYLVAPSELAKDMVNHLNNYSFAVLRKCTVQKSIKLGDKIQVIEAFPGAAAREAKKNY